MIFKLQDKIEKQEKFTGPNNTTYIYIIPRTKSLDGIFIAVRTQEFISPSAFQPELLDYSYLPYLLHP